MSKPKTIVICSSAAFYEHAGQLADQLETEGYAAVIPETARKMRKTGDYDVSHYKTWQTNAADFHIKQHLMDEHFKEISQGDAILVVNDPKHGVPGYIGANVLMEMAIAYYLKKPIFVLNNVTDQVAAYEEVIGMGAQQLQGDLKNIKF